MEVLIPTGNLWQPNTLLIKDRQESENKKFTTAYVSLNWFLGIAGLHQIVQFCLLINIEYVLWFYS